MPKPSEKLYPVAIVGGGPCGLMASILLSKLGIEHVVFERYPGTSIHPKCCGMNQRTMELFRAIGLEDAVKAIAAPDDVKGRTAWYTSYGPDGREVLSRDSWGGGAYAEEYQSYSPSRYEILPQIRLEPLMVAKVRELSPNALQFGVEVVELVEEGKEVIVKTRSRSGEDGEVRARFVIAADGGRSMTDKLGVPWEGEQAVLQMISVHFKANIRSQHPDPRNFLTWFTHPDHGGMIGTGYLYQIGPWPFDSPEAKVSEEWVFACAPGPTDPVRFDTEAMIARLRRTIKIPDLPIEVLSLSSWTVDAKSAERYRVGRVFLVGDAAHRIPPWGALGMNTGVQDVQNLVWKLKLALNDENRFDRLLDSYDIERRPIGRRVGVSSLHNLRSHGLDMDAALGMSPSKSAVENTAELEQYFDKSHPAHAGKARAVERAQRVLDLEFKAPGVEVGWFYPSVDVDKEGADDNHGGQLLENGELDSDFYKPTTIPGHHLPHAWVSKNGQTVAVRDLMSLDKLLLLSDDTAWKIVESDLVHVETIGESGWVDTDGDWNRQMKQHKALLVRPDGIIAWRGKGNTVPDNWQKIIERALMVGDGHTQANGMK